MFDNLDPLLREWYNVYLDHSGMPPENKLTEEVSEFLEAKPRTKHKLEEGVAVMIVVMTELTHEGFDVSDIEDALLRKLLVNINREWITNADGTISHRKNS